MTQLSDKLHLGGAITNTILGGSGGRGIGPINGVAYDIVPLTKNASAFAASQSPGASALTLSAGTGVTAIVDAYNVTRYTADVARCVTITSGGNDSGITFLISGFDAYGQPLTQNLTGSNASVATTTKAFLSVVSITPSAAIASTVTAGTSDTFGLPVLVTDKAYIDNVGWANTLGFNAATMVVGDSTNPATNITGDVRGTIAPSSASDGVKRLVVSIILTAQQLSSTATTAQVLGQTNV